MLSRLVQVLRPIQSSAFPSLMSIRFVSTLQRQTWKRKKDKFLRMLKERMRKLKLPQIDVTAKSMKAQKAKEKKRSIPIQWRVQESHKLFPRER
jgi:hypothetical protein